MALSKVTLVKVPHNELKENMCPAILVLMLSQRKTDRRPSYKGYFFTFKEWLQMYGSWTACFSTQKMYQQESYMGITRIINYLCANFTYFKYVGNTN